MCELPLPDGITSEQALEAAQLAISTFPSGPLSKVDLTAGQKMVDYALSEDFPMLAHIFLVRLTDAERALLPESFARFADAFRSGLGLSATGYGEAIIARTTKTDAHVPESPSLSDAQIVERQAKMRDWDKNARLEGIELSAADKAFFEEVDRDRLTVQEAIDRLLKPYRTNDN